MEINFKATIQKLQSTGPAEPKGLPTVTLTLQGVRLTEREIADIFTLQNGESAFVTIRTEEPEGAQLGFGDLPPEGELPDPFESGDPGIEPALVSDTGVPAAFYEEAHEPA